MLPEIPVGLQAIVQRHFGEPFLIIWQAFRAGQYLLATGFIPLIVAFSPISPIAISGRAFLWMNWIGLAAFLVAVIALKTERTLSLVDNKASAGDGVRISPRP